ncbi:ribosomal protein S18-alanine N-acetyltransferase [Allosphingosinicella flava]|uniref:Ribosomal protein S18-alanine N-acetyltransferase n=1 Tax=Allosphingosinicella flava TaxID=2771430 RepID=A0A7T2GHW2_9SPHN|nr:ribosomal protein S18-alanine N-acetyltransferase [Sphingosinicella flava]QPQ54181.1 ribosomal protein S18-alanine N-acetyltransferase [Sphingosinicella flava]
MTRPDPVRIEAGGIADLDAVMAVMSDSFDPSFGEAWTAPQCAGILPMAGVWLSLARIGDTVAGFSLGRIVLREAELLLLAVRRDFQGIGVGKKLVDHFIADSRARNAEHLHLEVRDGNAAVRLYEAAGFHRVGTRRNYYCGTDGALFHALTLSRSSNI